MVKNLNEKLYSRFGLSVDKEKVEKGFNKHFTNKVWKMFYSLRKPGQYDSPYQEELYDVRDLILDSCCKEMFLDRGDYEFEELWGDKKISVFIDHIFSGVFNEILLKLQILLNVFYKHGAVREDLETLVSELIDYTKDFPILELLIKEYKTKAPQILPSKSKRFDKDVVDTLGVLDTEKFKDIVSDFESVIKVFSKAKTDTQLKSVVSGMHSVCDEVVKVVLDNKSKSFKSATNKDDHKLLGLNGDQKEIFKQIKKRMDTIKHGGTGASIDKDEVEMLISLSTSFVRFVAVKYNKKL